MGRDNPPSADWVAQRLIDLKLADERDIRDVWSTIGSRAASADEFLTILVGREILTNYQVELLLAGEKTGFFFGDYKALYQIGAGAFAKVYRAVHTKTGEIVALKVLREDLGEDAKQYSQFIREGKIGLEIQHKNIAGIRAVYSKKNMHFLVMDFIEGQNLRKLVRIRKKLDPKMATKLTCDIAAGLAYAAEKGLTHRDMKLSNVLVTMDGTAKLVDFGLAGLDTPDNNKKKASKSGKNTEPEVDRTVDYVTLERITKVKKDDERSDIFFLGCMFYEMLTGKPALEEASKDRIKRTSEERFRAIAPIRQLDPTLPDSVIVCVKKAMSLDPRRRYQTPTMMHKDLLRVLDRIDADVAKRAERLAADDKAAKSSGHIATNNSGILSCSKSGSTMVQGAAIDTADPNQQEGGFFAATASGVNIAAALGEGPTVSTQLPQILVVEADEKTQGIFRNYFKKSGYKVILTRDPHWAYSQVRGRSIRVGCIILSALKLGENAVKVYREFLLRDVGNTVPILLILDKKQESWKDEVEVDDNHQVVVLPVKMRELRKKVASLFKKDI